MKVLAKELDKALAGTSLLVARRDDEIEILKVLCLIFPLFGKTGRRCTSVAPKMYKLFKGAPTCEVCKAIKVNQTYFV